MSENAVPPKRSPGGQPGNLNGLKHGLYIEGKSIRNTTPIERAHLNDLGTIIANTKDYVEKLYQKGLQCKTIEEYNLTMHNIAAAGMALSRLISIHNQFVNSPLPSELVITKATTLNSLVKHFHNRVSTMQELADDYLPEDPAR